MDRGGVHSVGRRRNETHHGQYNKAYRLRTADVASADRRKQGIPPGPEVNLEQQDK
jgi:hypothetical protein